MTRTALFIWSCLVAWAGAAFIHVVDADVNGVQALLSPSALASVTAVAALMLVPILFFWWAFRRGRWRGLLGAIVAPVIGIRLVAGALGGAGAFADVGGTSLASLAMLYGAVVVLALLPAIWIEWRIDAHESAAAGGALRPGVARDSRGGEHPDRGAVSEIDE